MEKAFRTSRGTTLLKITSIIPSFDLSSFLVSKHATKYSFFLVSLYYGNGLVLNPKSLMAMAVMLVNLNTWLFMTIKCGKYSGYCIEASVPATMKGTGSVRQEVGTLDSSTECADHVRPPTWKMAVFPVLVSELST
jgi:hypothetical protein